MPSCHEALSATPASNPCALESSPALYERMKVVRFEAMFKLTEDLMAAGSVEACSEVAVRHIKFLTDSTCWRLLLPHGSQYLAVDAQDGLPQLRLMPQLSAWETERWTRWRPEEFDVNDAALARAPAHLHGPSLRHLYCLPIERATQRVGLFMSAGRKTSASAMDQKFTRMAASMLAVHLGAIELRRQATELLVDQATRDGLTGLLNRRTVIERLTERRATIDADALSLAVLIADIDHFKSINDTYGHPAGDEVLKQVAQRLTAAVRRGEHFGRYGGEEFLIVLNAKDSAGALADAERLRRCIGNRPFRLTSTPSPVDLLVTLSLGVSHLADSPWAGNDQLIKRADEALYASKAGGRNRVTIAQPCAVKPLAAAHV